MHQWVTMAFSCAVCGPKPLSSGRRCCSHQVPVNGSAPTGVVVAQEALWQGEFLPSSPKLYLYTFVIKERINISVLLMPYK